VTHQRHPEDRARMLGDTQASEVLDAGAEDSRSR
jgi:hypothetical protein